MNSVMSEINTKVPFITFVSFTQNEVCGTHLVFAKEEISTFYDPGHESFGTDLNFKEHLIKVKTLAFFHRGGGRQGKGALPLNLLVPLKRFCPCKFKILHPPLLKKEAPLFEKYLSKLVVLTRICT